MFLNNYLLACEISTVRALVFMSHKKTGLTKGVVICLGLITLHLEDSYQDDHSTGASMQKLIFILITISWLKHFY